MDLDRCRHNVEVLQYVKKQQAKLKELEEVNRAAIEEAMGHNEIGELDGKVVVTWRHTKSRRFNQSEHKAKEPGCHEIYYETKEGRQFVVEG